MVKDNSKQLTQPLENLRSEIANHHLDGYLLTTTDEFLSEYPADYAKRLEYITNFDGSFGLALVLPRMVLFFTDGRYLTQAKLQLPASEYKIFDIRQIGNFAWHDYINSEAKIGYDPRLFTKNILQYFSSLKLQAVQQNLVDAIWHEQPPKPNSNIYGYPIEICGISTMQKLADLRALIQQEGAEAIFIADPNSVCWLLNIRARDVEFSALLLAQLLVTEDTISIFTWNKHTSAINLAGEVKIFEPTDIAAQLQNIQGKILFDPKQISTYIHDNLNQELAVAISDPCMLAKSVKNTTELKLFRQHHLTDSVVLCKLLAKLSQSEDIQHLSELDVAQQITAWRNQHNGYKFDSFPTICGYQANSAIIHYRPTAKTAKLLKDSGILLIDTGGQYLGATTDMTRTIFIGKVQECPIKYQEFYTRVLKGHIALALAIFPANKTTGAHLDVLARQYLWQVAADYPHGTGHGVGAGLSVHEGPQNVSPLGFHTTLKAGMVLSNEPGYYQEGEFGIRIENLVYVKEYAKNYLAFENLTLVPYAKELILPAMLTKAELAYLQNYYQAIKNQLVPLLGAAEQEWVNQQISWAL